MAYTSYQFLGFDSQNRDVYKGSDGQLYTGDPNGMNGMGLYYGDYGADQQRPSDPVTEAPPLAATPGGATVAGGSYTPSQGNDPGTWRTTADDPDAGGNAGGAGGTGAGSSGSTIPSGAPSVQGPSVYGPQIAPGPGGLDPWSRSFAPSATASMDLGDAPAFDAPTWQAPTWQAPADFKAPEWQAPAAFKAPSGDEVFQDPGYQFRADQGQQRLAASAAAQGLLRSGGTLKDILGYGQSLASQEYGDVYNRRLNEYGQAYNAAADTYKNQYTAAADDYTKAYNASKDQFTENYGAKRDEYDRNYQAAVAKYAPVMATWDTKRGDKATAYDREWKQYLQDYDAFQADRNFKLRALGG